MTDLKIGHKCIPCVHPPPWTAFDSDFKILKVETMSARPGNTYRINPSTLKAGAGGSLKFKALKVYIVSSWSARTNTVRSCLRKVWDKGFMFDHGPRKSEQCVFTDCFTGETDAYV